jgi:hypothetical protein
MRTVVRQESRRHTLVDDADGERVGEPAILRGRQADQPEWMKEPNPRDNRRLLRDETN